MPTLTGAMEESYTYFSIRRKLLMCFLIFSAADANTMEKVVGSEVMLPCRNESLSSLTQLTWKMNEILLFAYSPNKPLHTSPKAWKLNLNMSLSEDELYPLIIERVNQSHTGNYSCESSTPAGVLEQRWRLIITEANTMEKVVGSEVMLPCKNKSLSSLTQLTWKMNEILLFSYSPNKPLHTSPKAWKLNLNMSLSEDELYPLIIERVNQSHTGNYSCETSTTEEVLEQRWRLIITDAEHEEAFVIPVAAVVYCATSLVFIFTLMVVKIAYKCCTGSSRH